MRPIWIGLATGLLVGCGANRGTSKSRAADKAGVRDPYAPLALYNGKWDVKSGDDQTTPVVHLANHCEKTGVFFVCEQVVNGKSEDLVVFLPVGALGDTLSYRTQGLSARADRLGDWGFLAITGDRWVYSSQEVDSGKTVYWRTVNVFTGPDQIHFERQRSPEGTNWTTLQQGNEQRAP